MSPSGASAWWPRPPRPAPTRGCPRAACPSRTPAARCGWPVPRRARCSSSARRGGSGFRRAELESERRQGPPPPAAQRQTTGPSSTRHARARCHRQRGAEAAGALPHRGDERAAFDIPRQGCGAGRFIQDLLWPGMLFGRVGAAAAPWCGARFLQPGQGCGHAGWSPWYATEVSWGRCRARGEAIRAATALAAACSWQGGTPFPEPHKLGEFLVQQASKTTVLSEKSDPSRERGSTVLSATYTKPSSRTLPSTVLAP